MAQLNKRKFMNDSISIQVPRTHNTAHTGCIMAQTCEKYHRFQIIGYEPTLSLRRGFLRFTLRFSEFSAFSVFSAEAL